MKPMHDYVVVRRIRDQKDGALIHIPDIAETKPRIGIVEAVGPGRRLEDGSRAPMDVQVGDRVKFSTQQGEVVDLGDGERLLIREPWLEAVLASEVDANAVGSDWPRYITEGVRE